MKYSLDKIFKIICLQGCDLHISNDTQIIAVTTGQFSS